MTRQFLSACHFQWRDETVCRLPATQNVPRARVRQGRTARLSLRHRPGRPTSSPGAVGHLSRSWIYTRAPSQLCARETTVRTGLGSTHSLGHPLGILEQIPQLRERLHFGILKIHCKEQTQTRGE